MLFPELRRVAFVLALEIAAIAGCGRREGAPPPAAQSSPPVTGIHTFAIVPAQSTASYHASELFLPDALERLGMRPGKAEAVGTTQAIEGQFELDPEQPGAAAPDQNTFTVRLNTLTSNQKKRDDYIRQIRDDGPSFDKYPDATFKATAIEGRSTATASGRELTLKLTGDLRVREITKQVVFEVKAQVMGDLLTGMAATHLLLSDFGIGPIDFPPLLKVDDPIEVDVQFTARAQP